jgi:hypothetical protein
VPSAYKIQPSWIWVSREIAHTRIMMLHAATQHYYRRPPLTAAAVRTQR